MKSLETIVHSLMPRNKYDRLLILARDIYGWEFLTFSRRLCFSERTQNSSNVGLRIGLQFSYICIYFAFINDGKKFLSNSYMKSSIII